ncbi:DNA polymerase III subunit alpha [Candidatus Dependentiae bacterium]|nr:MAG: DNA polymerase III subunit alpha [Candidatus Dependentiae bacterium]
MSKYFTHLHLHTEYSLLDGAISLEKVVAFAQKYQLKAIGISDHGNIFGAVKFFQLCKKAGIKPILGMEAYLTEDAAIKDVHNRYNHLLIIVENAIGYRNLCKLISFSYQEGFYFKPRIDYKILEKHSEGLIITTACLGGHIPTLLMNGQEKEVRNRVDWFVNFFGRDRFYFEVQPEEQEEQKILNQKLYTLSKELNLECVVGCDCHYSTLEDHEAHELMLAIQTHAKITDEDRFSFGPIRAYMKTPQEICELFKGHEDAIWNTGKIADRCEFDFETGKLFFPHFEIPNEHNSESYFKKLCQDGFDKLLYEGHIQDNQKELYQNRLDQEIDLIIKMGFADYFLIVSDFIKWAKRNNIPVGPGRGSAAGSLVSWALEITNIDPLKYNLLFERFLNPERVSMPDIDIDFCIEGRERVINYVRETYGHDKVCQIITFGTMMAKGVIKDVARALSFSFEDSNMITSLIPDQHKITLKEALEQERQLYELVENNPKVKKLFDLAFRLEGLTRHASKHAAGIVILPEPVDEVLPVYIPPKTNELVTQYAMTELEALGFLKMDFLGLKNLTLIDRTIKLIETNHMIDIDINKLPHDDSKTFELFCQGNTSGVFQLESDGIKELLRKLQPTTFEDIIAVNALYRPGPLGSGMVDDFIERRHGKQKINYLLPELEPILKETYGVIVYQEQVIKIAASIAGYSLGEADILRRAMGKKKMEVMVQQRELFLTRAQERGFDNTKAGELFDLMAYFAGYGFNKSHSAAYALIAYQTAYLKAHYPAEFMACLISLESTNPDKMSFYLQETKNMGLTLFPPNINQSESNFAAIEGNLLFGLQGIKNVGAAALENIIAERSKKPFADLLDFCTRVDLRSVNKRVIESLICAGAFDNLPGHRAQQFSELSKIIEYAVERKHSQETGQIGLFDLVSAQKKESLGDLYVFQSCAQWTNKEKLKREMEFVGFYLSAHPLECYKKQLHLLSLTPFAQLSKESEISGQEVTAVCAGLLKNRRDIFTKRGERMSFIQLEDMNTTAEIIIFPKLFKKVEEWLDEYNIFILKGAVDLTATQVPKIKANEFVPIELFFQEWSPIQKISLTLPDNLDETMIQELKQLFKKGSIQLELVFSENGKQLKLNTKEKIAVTQEVIDAIEHKNIKAKIIV